MTSYPGDLFTRFGSIISKIKKIKLLKLCEILFFKEYLMLMSNLFNYNLLILEIFCKLHYYFITSNIYTHLRKTSIAI